MTSPCNRYEKDKNYKLRDLGAFILNNVGKLFNSILRSDALIFNFKIFHFPIIVLHKFNTFEKAYHFPDFGIYFIKDRWYLLNVSLNRWLGVLNTLSQQGTLACTCQRVMGAGSICLRRIASIERVFNDLEAFYNGVCFSIEPEIPLRLILTLFNHRFQDVSHQRSHLGFEEEPVKFVTLIKNGYLDSYAALTFTFIALHIKNNL